MFFWNFFTFIEGDKIKQLHICLRETLLYPAVEFGKDLSPLGLKVELNPMVKVYIFIAGGRRGWEGSRGERERPIRSM